MHTLLVQFSDFFQNAVKSLGISKDVLPTEDDTGIDETVLSSLVRYSKHPSVLAIKRHLSSAEMKQFDFCKLDIDVIEKEVKNLDSAKKGTLKQYYT